MEINLAKYLDTIVRKTNDKYEIYKQVKEFISVAKEIGGLKPIEKKFIDEILTDGNIKMIIKEGKTFTSVYRKFMQLEKDYTKKETISSGVCGSVSFAERRNSDRCGSSVTNDRCGPSNVTITNDRCGPSAYADRCGGGRSRGC